MGVELPPDRDIVVIILQIYMNIKSLHCLHETNMLYVHYIPKIIKKRNMTGRKCQKWGLRLRRLAFLYECQPGVKH